MNASKKQETVRFREEGEIFIFPDNELMIVLVPVGKKGIQKEVFSVGIQRKEETGERKSKSIIENETGQQGFSCPPGCRSDMYGFQNTAEAAEQNMAESITDEVGRESDRLRKEGTGNEEEGETEKKREKAVEAEEEKAEGKNKENKEKEVEECGTEPDILYLYEDRWRRERELMEKRIRARLNCFRSVFARKCRVADVEGYCRQQGAAGTVERKKCVNEFNEKIRDFLERYHQYGYAKCRYKYLLFYGDEIVGAAAFSAGRPICRNIEEGAMAGEQAVFQSFEWVRYASLPDVRIAGGMGKILQAFLRERSREYEYVEVMTYSDNEWSWGKVYEKLGFRYAGEREPVEYFVNTKTWERFSRRRWEKAALSMTGTGAGTKIEKEIKTKIETEMDAGMERRAEMKIGTERSPGMNLCESLDMSPETEAGAEGKTGSCQIKTASPGEDAASDAAAVIDMPGGSGNYYRIVNKGSRKFLLQRVTKR